ncbi:AbrB/MazE/SpoVT family DNA-binding domain-containing protein [Paucibacter soli]|uniref:AbrB/MazE/SpoVT family DNA-binding domain-containing protein n=1 Tax=Paucibacter soli TaxID=3133433 RepID=UPI00309E6D4D
MSCLSAGRLSESAKVMPPYFLTLLQLLAKITSKNQLTLPKSVTEALGPVQYFDVQTKAGQIVLTPVRIQRGDALRAKLAELDLSDKTIERALAQEKPPARRKAPARKKPLVAKKTAAKPLSGSARRVGRK